MKFKIFKIKRLLSIIIITYPKRFPGNFLDDP